MIQSKLHVLLFILSTNGTYEDTLRTENEKKKKKKKRNLKRKQNILIFAEHTLIQE